MEDLEQQKVRGGRNRKFTLALLACALGAGLAAIGLVLSVKRSGGDTAAFGMLIGVGIGLVLGGAIIAWKTRPSDTRWTSETATNRRDRLQAGRARQLWLLPIFAILFLGLEMEATWTVIQGHGRAVDYVRVALSPLYAWLTTLIAMGWDKQSLTNRRFLEDELTQSLRARAMAAAFIVVMAGVTIAFGLGLWRAEVGIAALPFVLAAGGATAGIRFAWLDRQAGRDG